VKRLRHHFQGCSLDFDRFYLHVKRTGVFMHTVNHPTAAAIVMFAKCIAMRLGATERLWDTPIEITDEQTNLARWPIYPEVGRRLAGPAAYDWVLNGRHYDLEQFIVMSYRHYAESGTQRDGIELNASPEVRQRFDQVLGDRVRGIT
jgi:hypothetical protein